MGKMENILRRSMQSAGKGVETLLVYGKKLKKFNPQKNPARPSSGFSSVGEEKQLFQLLAEVEKRSLLPLLPKLDHKTILYLSLGKNPRFIDTLRKKSDTRLIELDISTNSSFYQLPEKPDHDLIRGSADSLPLRDDCLDFIFYPGATESMHESSRTISEAARCLKHQGRILLACRHPLLEYIQNPALGFRKNISQLFAQLKAAGFFIEEFRETSLSETQRHPSLSKKLAEEMARYHGLPMIFLMRAVLIKKDVKK